MANDHLAFPRSGEIPPHLGIARPLHAAPAAMVTSPKLAPGKSISAANQLGLGSHNENWVRFVKCELHNGNEDARTAGTQSGDGKCGVLQNEPNCFTGHRRIS
jgi:hypothetical protein